MGSPYTTYPDPVDNPYLIGIDCPYCNVEADKRCVTSGGNAYGERCHKKRRDAALDQGVDLKMVRPPPKEVEVEPEIDVTITGKVSSLKMAFWYIDKLGGVKRARAYFEAASRALDNLPEEIEA